MADGQSCSLPVHDFSTPPEAIVKIQQYYEDSSSRSLQNSNFLKGVKWSPDGGCLLSASEDNRLSVFDLPEDALERASIGSSAERDALSSANDSCSPALQFSEGETIYDYAWFPAMHADDPVSCVFVSTSRTAPIHMWDAAEGGLRCTYRAYDAADEVTAATSVAFSPGGEQLLGGFNKAIRIWDTSRPGRDYTEIVTHKRKSEGIPGIISCMAFSPDGNGILGVGSYSGYAALYDSKSMELLYLLQGHKGGLTQVSFAPDGNFLFTGARTDPEIWCWDVRYQSGALYKLQRDTPSTNQRISFDIEPCGKHLASGGQDGRVRIYDLAEGKQVGDFTGSEDTINGFQFHPFLPLAATASGQRRYSWVLSSDSEDDSESEASLEEETGRNSVTNALCVWRFQHSWMDFDFQGNDRE